MLKVIEYLKSIIMPPIRHHTVSDFLSFVQQKKKIVILTPEHCLFIAELLKSTLAQLDISSTIIFRKSKYGYGNLPYIVICPQVYKKLPVNYIAFQMEQSESSSWFTKEYFNKLNKAVAIFDYSLQNVEYLKNNIKDSSKVFYMPLSINKGSINYFKNDITKRKYDIVFYGADSSTRRKEILNALKLKFKVKIITNIYKQELYKELSNSKIVINIHYYENALLETTRLYECLSLKNNVIISEKGRDQDQHLFLEQLVDFVDTGDVEGLVQKIELYLKNSDLLDRKLKENISIIEKLKFTEFEIKLKEFFNFSS